MPDLDNLNAAVFSAAGAPFRQECSCRVRVKSTLRASKQGYLAEVRARVSGGECEIPSPRQLRRLQRGDIDFFIKTFLMR